MQQFQLITEFPASKSGPPHNLKPTRRRRGPPEAEAEPNPQLQLPLGPVVLDLAKIEAGEDLGDDRGGRPHVDPETLRAQSRGVSGRLSAQSERCTVGGRGLILGRKSSGGVESDPARGPGSDRVFRQTGRIPRIDQGACAAFQMQPTEGSKGRSRFWSRTASSRSSSRPHRTAYHCRACAV